MNIGNDLDDTAMRGLFGLRLYEKGTALVERGSVSQPKEVYPGIEVYEVTDLDGIDRIVIRRGHRDGIEVIDCDCSDECCAHMAAVLLSSLEEYPVSEETDPGFIEELEELIDGAADDIVHDPEYDEEDNYYDDWEREKYRIKSVNDEVEYEHTSDILDNIILRVSDPDDAVILIDRLLSVLGELNYNNGGIDDALFDHGSDICTLFSHASPATIAEILKNDCYIARSHYRTYLEHVPDDVKDEAYALLEGSSKLGDIALEMKFERGDYDSYIDCSEMEMEAIFRVVDHLDKQENEAASRYAEMLIGCPRASDNRKAARMLSEHGYREEAAEIYRTIFLQSHAFDDYQSMKDNTRTIDTEKLLDDLAETTLSRETFDNNALKTLIMGGKGDDVDRYVKRIGFVPRRDYRDYDCGMIPVICKALESGGFVESAAILGRGLIELRLDMKNAEKYQDAVDMMRYMDGQECFEELDVPQSEFRSRLKMEYPKMRKFWGLYEGTWHR